VSNRRKIKRKAVPVQVDIATLQAEAGAMALELRFKDRLIAQFQAETAQLRAEIERLTPKEGDAAPEQPAGATEPDIPESPGGTA
jgi:hypothetical protein